MLVVLYQFLNRRRQQNLPNVRTTGFSTFSAFFRIDTKKALDPLEGEAKTGLSTLFSYLDYRR